MGKKLNYIINHVFLPPKLPQNDDANVTNSVHLVEQLLAALTSFRDRLPEQSRSEWIPCIKMVGNLLELQDPFGGLVAPKLEIGLTEMFDGDILACHIRAQNAGLIVRRSSNQYLFELFEASPANKAVFKDKGRLIRCFPGPAFAIDQDRMADPSLVEQLTQLLTKLDAETPEEALPSVTKARSAVIETRDTVHPMFVTEMLGGILRAIGKPVDATRIYKHTREDVLWNDALNPWHRSPLWLCLRVALQTSLIRKDDEEQHLRYKSFMLFFMASVLKRALEASIPSDVLFIMTAKISGRALKLGAVPATPWLQYVETVVSSAQQELLRRWKLVEETPDAFRAQQDWLPLQLSFDHDTELTLSSLRPYLAKVQARSESILTCRPVTFDCGPRILQHSSKLPDLSLLQGPDQIFLHLADLELWVQESLEDWLRTNMDFEHTCSALAEVVNTYISAASAPYTGSPEDTSLMLLTAMELWVALDMSALRHCSLLRDYDPGFPTSLFEPLLLPKKSQMGRLLRVELYLAKRRTGAKSGCPSIFRSYGEKDSFAVRYFEQSPIHQKLHQEIETDATLERSRKHVELANKSQQHKKLMDDSSGRTHEYVERWRQFYDHSSSCQKCLLESQAKHLEIDVHEWPLPSGDLKAKAVVFELDVPTVVSKWRDTTYSILVDVLSVEPRAPRQDQGRQQKVYTLLKYDGLMKFVKSGAARLQLASEAKPFVKTHYRSKKISDATTSDVCVNNGLIYSMYDSKMARWTKDVSDEYDIREKCTLRLPPGPYTELQYAVGSTIHTSNEVIAGQENCSKALTLHEFHAFGVLRSGHRLQWRNMARELRSRILNFSSHETNMLFTQAAWQAGPAAEGKSCRESHEDLEEKEYGESLLLVLNDALRLIEGNWQGAAAARTLIILAARLLSLSPYSSIHQDCHRFLRKTRAVSLRWARNLEQKLQEGQEAQEMKTLGVRVLEMALTCHATFDVDPQHLPDLLQEEEDVAVLIECAIIIHDRCPTVTDSLPAPMRMLLRRHQRLLCGLESLMRERIIRVPSGLDSTVKRIWAGYGSGSPWRALKTPEERWLVTETFNEGATSPRLVHYNLLDGSLLVDGSPLTRLPRSYEANPTYRRLFGDKVLDVIPSNMRGMAFETRTQFSDHQLYFGMHESELIVQAVKDQQLYELLPSHALNGDFPQDFIENYVHWLEINSGCIEWRSLLNAWRSSASKNWKMPSYQSKESFLVRGPSRLIDFHSPTTKSIAKILSPLEDVDKIHITLNCETDMLEVHLPRLNLDFFLRKGATQLESKQFRAMTVDANQSFGTLTGLSNKLVLRRDIDSSRSVIIPCGTVQFKPEGDHLRVNIDTGSAPQVPYHLYHIDRRIGQLVDNGRLKSKLFKAYLHATTSHCLADELTGQTGTEEALAILGSASVRSFDVLDEQEIDLLELIGKLSPRRRYYPPHLKEMQSVKWVATLSPLSQHNSLCKSVLSIFAQAQILSLFRDEIAQIPDSNFYGDQDLRERAMIRDSKNRVHGFGAENHTTKHDIRYGSRDHVTNSTREAQVHQTAKLVDDWSTNLRGCSQLFQEIQKWGAKLCGKRTEDVSPLGYDSKWLDSPASFLLENWCTLQVTLSRSVPESDKYKIMFFLSTMAYSPYAEQDLNLVQTLLAFATVPNLRAIGPPANAFFCLSDGFSPDRWTLSEIARNEARSFSECPESKKPELYNENWVDADERRRREYEMALEENTTTFVDALIHQWPEPNIHNPAGIRLNTYIAVSDATDAARVWFQSWHRNTEFKEYVRQTQEILDTLSGDQNLLLYSFLRPQYSCFSKRCRVDLFEIMERPAPSLSPACPANFDSWICQQDEDGQDHAKLELLLERLRADSSGHHEKRYVGDLSESFDALQHRAGARLSGPPKALKPLLERHLSLCKNHVSDLYQTICRCLETEISPTRRLACRAKMWPRLTTTSLLQNLAGCNVNSLRDDWKDCLIEYGLAISTLQRAERLLACVGNDLELLNELSNPGRQGWDAKLHPDWLLLEIENNILIRRVQAQIAGEMISPSSGRNSVMQLNMGEGKTSVIVPIVAAALADRKKLVRVVVLKPLSTGMFYGLLRTLGGMLGRRVYHMPISRSVQLNIQQAGQISDLCRECMDTGGILLVQPEHLLSFELMGLERCLSGDLELGNILTETQRWLDYNSRDILDESDEILSVRFELIYTMGLQRASEFSPDRWTIIQHVLGLVHHFAELVLKDKELPQGLELRPGVPGSFPRVRILQHLAAVKLMDMVARKVCEAGLPGVPVWNLPQHVRDVLFRYLTDPSVDEADMKPLQNHISDVQSMKSSLLLLRGLFARGILAFTLQQKRWRVNYGLDPSRTMLAVPYRAKDIPAMRADFSHPDVTIVLTCLSYYYGGLEETQLRTAFEKLVLCDHAQEEYDRWVRDAPELPPAFRELTSINLSDHEQYLHTIFPPLRLAKGAIDFYMASIVFPKEMREFPHKLSSSGWDIAREKVHHTTGFSGTNDSRYILPLSISQCEHPPQLHTNAAVLDCLLRPENTFKPSMQTIFDAKFLLDMVAGSEPSVRVILDVGAQVLELKNEEVATRWLERVSPSDTQAVVYFDDDNELSVLSRDGMTEPLMVSPFAKQMDQCLVYLDEAHTRGTDLKLPTNYRAAVTLGPNLPKDRLIQACMRMRKLGKGQSVMFCAPMEVERKILECSNKTSAKSIEVADVIFWSIRETYINTKKCIPLWATQGMRYHRRQAAMSEWPESEGGATINVAESLLETEAQTLDDRYGVGARHSEDAILLHDMEDLTLSARAGPVEAIRRKCREFELRSFGNAALQEEQERELSPEKEQQRQVERPPRQDPHAHSVHRDVKRFIQQGILDRSSDAFQPALEIFRNTSAVEFFEPGAWPRQLLATVDFARTIQCSSDDQHLDLFLRPVHWVVSRRTADSTDLVVVSPFEAQELLPSIRHDGIVTLHVYSARINMSTQALDDLSFCAVPAMGRQSGSWPPPPVIMQLNLFAGQLYLGSYEEYLSVCRFLGLSFRPPSDGQVVGCDSFVGPESRARFDELMERLCPFGKSPVGFVKGVMALRRKGMGFHRSHFGRILNGELLDGDQFGG